MRRWFSVLLCLLLALAAPQAVSAEEPAYGAKALPEDAQKKVIADLAVFDFPLEDGYLTEYTENPEAEAAATQVFKNAKVRSGVLIVGKYGAPLVQTAYGVRNRAKDPVTLNTQFRVASVTKLVTAIGLMRLWDAGLFDLDAPLSDYLPMPVVNPAWPTQEVTARQILSHTSSIRDGESYLTSLSAPPPFPDLLAKDCFAKTAPGTQWDYSNLAAGIAGCVLEGALQKPFDRIMRETVFEPLNIDASFHPGRIGGTLSDAWRLLPLKRDGPQGLLKGGELARVVERHACVGCRPGSRRTRITALERVDDYGVHLLLGKQALHGVSELNFAASASALGLKKLHDARSEQVAADDEQVRRRVLGRGLLDQTRHLPHGAFLLAGSLDARKGAHALAGDDAVAADLVCGHRRHRDNRAVAVLGRHLGHVDAHLAIGHEVVAQQHEERLSLDGLRSAQHRMAQALGVILVGKGHRHGRGSVHRVGLLGLAARAQHVLKLLVNAKVGLDLRLLVRVDDDDLVDALGLERLLDHVLDDRLVEHREQLLGSSLGSRQKTGAEAGRWDN